MTRDKSNFLQYIQSAGVLSEAQCQKIQTLENEKQIGIGKIILSLAYLQEDRLARHFSEFTGLDLLTPPNTPAVLPALPATISEKYFQQIKACPVAVQDGKLYLAMLDPLDEEAKRMIAAATGLDVVPAIAVKSHIDHLLERLSPATNDAKPATQVIGLHQQRSLDENSTSDAPTIKAVDRIIDRAILARASDIHLDTRNGGLSLRYRIDGILQPAPQNIESASPEALASRIKLMAGLDIAEKRLPQDGRARIVSGGQEIDLRIATMPSLHGESLTIRLLNKAHVPLDLSGLGYADDHLEKFRALLACPYGLLLVTGPTGSGKTTTLYAALKERIDGTTKIMSIEDPVEYDLDGVTQTQVNAEIGLGFATVLRSVLRHDPDIILVGEIRDRETAEIAIQAALTGHLVLATLHTNSAAAAITRLLDMEVADYLIAAALRGIVAQRLVRKHEQGRLAISEILIVSDRIRQLIGEGAGAMAIDARAREDGMRTLLEDGMQKVAARLTTEEEVYRVVLDRVV